jgi:hypothetical protein
MNENRPLSRQSAYKSDDDYRLIEYGYVTDRYPREGGACELDAGAVPRIRIEPRLARNALDAVVPQHSVGDRHMPREGEVVYYIRLKDDLGVCLGTRATDHDGYSYERRIDHADTDGVLRWDEEGNLLLNSETVLRDGACEQIDGPLKTGHLDVTEGNLELLSKILTEGDALKTGHLDMTEGNLELLSKIDDGNVKEGHLDVTEGVVELLSQIDGDSARLQLDGDEVTVDVKPKQAEGVIRRQELTEHRESEVHDEPQPPETHGDAAHSDEVATSSEVTSAVDTHTASDTHDEPQPLTLSNAGGGDTTSTTLEAGDNLEFNGNTLHATGGSGGGDGGAPSDSSFVTTNPEADLANSTQHSALTGDDLHEPKAHNHSGETLTPNAVDVASSFSPPEVQSRTDIPSQTTTSVFFVQDEARLVVRTD